MIVMSALLMSKVFAQDLVIDCQVNLEIKGVNTFSMESTLRVHGDLTEDVLIEDVELNIETVKASHNSEVEEVSIVTNLVVTKVGLSTYDKPIYNVVLQSSSDDVYLPVWGKLNAGFTPLSSYISTNAGYFRSTCTLK